VKKLGLTDVRKFVDEKTCKLYKAEIEILNEIKLNSLLRKKNAYFLAFSGISSAPDFVEHALDVFLWPIDEKLFGDVLRDLAVFIAGKTCGGRKSPATGIDLQFENKGTLFLVSVKSGPSWGNKSQQDKQEADFKKAVRVLKQSRHTMNVQPVLGICYGRTKTSYVRGALKVVGQNFWYFISENRELYTDIIEPLGHRAKQHNEKFARLKGKIVNSFTKDFIGEFCDKEGAIDWKKLVEFNSGNLDLVKQSAKGG
jgi:hypothetical protein